MSDDSDSRKMNDGSAEGSGEGSEFDLLLPMANVSRIMKNSIPETAKISKEAKECMQECVTEFVAFVTSEAAEICTGEKRKTLNGQDVIHAMISLGMENYAEVLKIYLARYRTYLSEKNVKKERDGDGGGSSGEQGYGEYQDVNVSY
ncbi:transcriptional activator Hap3p [Trichomonascus vanleenenianus]|uniref:Hap3p n=1 Tax=Trichomonascus vanleenenianus TaxID=2268995 RepID=UPI003EC966CC